MRGFRGFRKPELITQEAIDGFLTRSGLSADNANLYIMWTGGEYKRRLGSARSQALYALNVKDKPVKLADWLREAARCRDTEQGIGFDPGVVRSGLFLHQGAKPCVYLALERRADGSFTAAKDVPTPDPKLGFVTLKRGDLVIGVEDAKDAAAEVQAVGDRVIETAATRALPAPKTTAQRRAAGRKGK